MFTDATFKPDKLDKRTWPTQMWCTDRAATEAKYGHISTWCVAASGGRGGGSGRRMGRGCAAFGFWLTIPHTCRDVSQVTDFSDAFSGCAGLNEDLSAWDVSSATNLNFMCEWATPNVAWDVCIVARPHFRTPPPTPPQQSAAPAHSTAMCRSGMCRL